MSATSAVKPARQRLPARQQHVVTVGRRRNRLCGAQRLFQAAADAIALDGVPDFLVTVKPTRGPISAV